MIAEMPGGRRLRCKPPQWDFAREAFAASEMPVRILTGGDITPGTPLTEQTLLDLEREAFLSLCGEPKTVERIGFTLKTGKPLRN